MAFLINGFKIKKVRINGYDIGLVRLNNQVLFGSGSTGGGGNQGPGDDGNPNLINLTSYSFPITKNGLTVSYNHTARSLTVQGTCTSGFGINVSMPLTLNGTYLHSLTPERDFDQGFYFSLDSLSETMLNGWGAIAKSFSYSGTINQYVIWFDSGYTFDNTYNLSLLPYTPIEVTDLFSFTNNNISLSKTNVEYATYLEKKVTIVNTGSWSRLACTISGLEANAQYTISADIINTAGLNCGFFVDNNNHALGTDTNASREITLTTDASGNFYVEFYTNFSGAASTNEVIFNNITLIKEEVIVDPYVTNPVTELGDISRAGELRDSTSYYRTADYVYVAGKTTLTLTNGTGGVTRVLCYDENKTFMQSWNVDVNTSYSYAHVTDGGTFSIPTGCAYIKARWSNTSSVLTINYQ